MVPSAISPEGDGARFDRNHLVRMQPFHGDGGRHARSSTAATPSRGVIVMAHGGNEAWNQDVEAVVAPLRETFPVSIAYGMADTATIRAAVRALEDEGVEQIAVVRLFVSGDSFKPETEYILNLRPDLPDDVREANLTMARAHGGHGGHGGGHGGMEPAAPIGLTARAAISGEGLIDSDLIGPILADRVRALSVNPSNESVLLIGHGPGDDKENERWLAAMERHARGHTRAGALSRGVHRNTARRLARKAERRRRANP